MDIKGLLGGGTAKRSEDDYRNVENADVKPDSAGVGPQIKTAEVSNQNDLVPVKDAIYEGNIILVELTNVSPGSRKWQRIEDELVQVVDEVGGDIALNGNTQCIIAPSGVGIDTNKL